MIKRLLKIPILNKLMMEVFYLITKDMNIIDIVDQYPATVEVFKNYGMHCFGWMAARFENLEQGAQAHGLDVDAMLVDLNKVVQ